MASLALHSTRTPFPISSIFKGLFAASSWPLLPVSQLRWSSSPLESLWELLPPFLLAVPKKKTSHSRKAMRSANKGLKDKHNLVHCSACGSPKLAHHLCPSCYSTLSRGWKSQARSEGVGTVGSVVAEH